MSFIPLSLIDNSSTSINTLLQTEHPRLEDVLDNEFVIPELKSSNPKLLAFLCKPIIIHQLVSLITEVPKSFGLDPTESHRDHNTNKLALVASDILATDNEILCKYFLGIISSKDVAEPEPKHNSEESEIKEEIEICSDSDNNEKDDENSHDNHLPFAFFLRFLNHPVPVLFTMGGYFHKVLKNMFFMKPEVTGDYLFNKYFSTFKRITLHLYSDSISEIFSHVMKLEPVYFKNNPKDVFLNQRLELLKNLVGNIFEKPDSKMEDSLYMDLKWNSCLLISTILIQHNVTICGKELVEYLIEKDTLQRLFKGVLSPTESIACSHIICRIIEYFADTRAEKDGPAKLDLVNFTNSIPVPKFSEEEPFLDEVVNSIEGIVKLLKTEKDESNNVNFGQFRLKLVELVIYFMKLKNERINFKIISSGYLSLLLNLMKANPLSDILHQAITVTIKFILEQCSNDLKGDLIVQAKFLDFVIAEVANPMYIINKKKGTQTQKSYLAHLIVLSNAINTSLNKRIIGERTANEEWKKFSELQLKEINDKNSTKIGGDPICDKSYKETRKLVKIDEADMPATSNNPEESKEQAKNLNPNSQATTTMPTSKPKSTASKLIGLVENTNTGINLGMTEPTTNNHGDEIPEDIITPEEETKQDLFEQPVRITHTNGQTGIGGLGDISELGGDTNTKDTKEKEGGGAIIKHIPNEYTKSPTTPAGRRVVTKTMSGFGGFTNF